MASSSVSAESLDREEFEYSARRSRIRALRARSSSHTQMQYKAAAADSLDSTDRNGDYVPGDYDGPPGLVGIGAAPGEHESPTRLATRLKDKRGRPNHLHGKGKTVKDKRKLREKRRSTGVVHLPSTESTGDSLDEDDEKCGETRRNTSCNEVIDADNPQTPEDERARAFVVRNARNKSPSDLEADLEDNQDYDSTVSQSETNLTALGQCSPLQSSNKLRTRSPPENSNTNYLREDYNCRPAGYSRYDRDSENTPFYGGDSYTRVSAHKTRDRDLAELSKSRQRDLRSSSSQESVESKLLNRNKELEKMLEEEREENRRISQLLEERDRRIVQLEKEVYLLQQNNSQTGV